MDKDTNEPKHPLFYLLSLIFLGTVITCTWLNTPTSFDSITAEAWSAIAAFLSVIVACVALFTSFYQIQSSERSARLSIKPHCFFISVTPNTENEPVGISLRNNGLGPAVMVEWTFTIKGETIPEINKAGLDVVINRYHLNGLCQGMLLTPPSSLAANQTERIAYVPLPFYFQMVFSMPQSITANAAMIQLMKEVSFHLRYQSAYGEEDSISSL